MRKRFFMNYLLKTILAIQIIHRAEKARNRSAEFGRSGAVNAQERTTSFKTVVHDFAQIQNNLYSILIISRIDLHCSRRFVPIVELTFLSP